VLGIEINPYAAELARVTIWIGEIQWQIRNGQTVTRRPILDALDGIACRDAIMSTDSWEASWPDAEFIIGNPPFLGNKKMIRALSESYVTRLRQAFADRVPGSCDLVCYWFEKARALVESGRAARVGLVATNSIRGGANRRVLTRIAKSCAIFEGWSDEPWIVDGAAVRVSLVCFCPLDDALGELVSLNGQSVPEIASDLTSIDQAQGTVNLTTAVPLQENIRAKNAELWRREHWWLHGRTGDDLRRAIKDLKRYIATSQVAKHRTFVWLNTLVQPHQTVIAIARDDDVTFGVLQSRIHQVWALRMGTSLEDRPRYTPTTTFETFPFPERLTPDRPSRRYADDNRAKRVAEAAMRLDELRCSWLNPADLVRFEPEVVKGFPDRVLPLGSKAEKELKKRTLTNLYNARPAWLVDAHRALDEAVAAAYGWPADISDDEILARLLKLNQERASKSDS
jgi:type II restriction/modification system DNA methylase subunit YeeA